MKSALQLQLDNNYELLRVAYLKKAESTAPVINFITKSSIDLRLPALIPAAMQQSSNWDLDWFNHYE